MSVWFGYDGSILQNIKISDNLTGANEVVVSGNFTSNKIIGISTIRVITL